MINSIDSLTANGVGHLACDYSSDVSELPQYAEDNGLKLGTDCICVETGTVYMMQSDYSFVEI